MSFVSVNGTPVVRGTFSRPRTGAWHADLVVDARASQAASFAGSVQLAMGNATYRGSVYRCEPYLDALGVRIVAGAGGMGKTLPAKAYQNATGRIAVTDILAGAGEALSPTSDAATMARPLAKWVRVATTAAVALGALLKALGAPNWRFLDDGTLWIGFERWLAIAPGMVDLTNVAAGLGRLELATDKPEALVPGGTYENRRVAFVEHHIAGDRLRHTLWFEDEPRG